MKRNKKFDKKLTKSVSIIGGADGPTSVFIAGRTGTEGPIQRWKHGVRNWKFERKRKAAARQIAAGPRVSHTIEETLAYIQKNYHGVEKGDSYALYEERRKNLRLSLIQKYQPGLLGEEAPVKPLPKLGDQQEVETWYRQMMEQIQEREQRAASLPEEAFPMDYHLFLIDRGKDGQLEVEVELNHEQFSCSYAGQKEQLEPLLKEIYLYYGVSERDIREKTERYRMLETVLSA